MFSFVFFKYLDPAEIKMQNLSGYHQLLQKETVGVRLFFEKATPTSIFISSEIILLKLWN